MDPVSAEILKAGLTVSRDEVNKVLQMRIRQIKSVREQENLSEPAVKRADGEEAYSRSILGMQKAYDSLLEFYEKEIDLLTQERNHWRDYSESQNEQVKLICTTWLNQNRLWQKRK